MGRMTQEEARAVLKVGPRATPREVRSAYKKLALIYHPDKVENSEESTIQFQKISAAYKRLSNEDESDEFEIDEDYTFQLFRTMFQSERQVVRVSTEHGSFLLLGRCYNSRRYSNSSDEEFDASHYSFRQQEASRNADELINEESVARKKAEKKRIKKQRQRENRRQAKEELQKQREEIKQERQKINDPKSTPAMKDNKKNETKNAGKINKKKEKNAAQNKENQERNCDKSFQQMKHKYHKLILSKPIVERRKPRPPQQTDGAIEDEKEEDESDIDMNCAFFAKLANKKSLPVIKPKQASDTTVSSEEKQENVVPSTQNKTQVAKTEPEKTSQQKPSSTATNYQKIATEGNKKASDGKYSEAIALFTQAITLNSYDHRIFSNRSYCYDKLEQFERALQDADRAILLMPSWSKGFFRKGRAMFGLKKYADAEKAFLEVLKLDKASHDAETELFHVRVRRLQEMGFTKEQSVLAIRKFTTVNEAIENVLAGNIPDALEEDIYISDDEEEDEILVENIKPPEEPVLESTPFEREVKSSLWIGNVTEIVTEPLLHRYFIQFGPIVNIKINRNRMYAFVNYAENDSATKALKAKKCVEMMDTTLLLNYPAGRKFIPNRMQDRQKFDTVNSQLNTNGQSKERVKECYFWRNTGCYNGPKCRFLHIPEHQGIDSNRNLNNY